MRRRLFSLLLSPAVLLAACNGQSLQEVLQADPNLQPANPDSPNPTASACSEIARSRLPEVFPSGFCYPEAELQQVTESTLDEGTAVEARWATGDDAEQVQSFYREAFELENWEITNSADASAAEPIEAVKDGVRVAIATLGSSADGETAFTVSYRPSQTAQSEGEPAVASTTATEDAEGGPNETGVEPPTSGGDRATAQTFTDVDDAPDELQDYIRDLATLGVLDPAEGAQFKPNEPVTRRTFARWLFDANNRFYTESSKRIRTATGSDPAFQDVPASNPDFGKIQGLADAGLVPSALSGEATAVNFRPDAPMTRETLVQWKVPLDLRQSLPNATLDAVQQAWGFQDAAQLDPKALQAVLADHANGDQSNIRRAFGFTTLFQPKKAVTRAEAAAVLWHFGYQGEGRSAADLRQGVEGEVDQSEAEQSGISDE